MDDIHWGLLVSRVLHISAAIVAIGGAVFLRLAVMPGAKQALDEQPRELFHAAVRGRWRVVTHVCILLLLASGGVNFVALVLWPDLHPLPYHPIFGIKVLAALGVFFIACALPGRGPALAAVRRATARWLSVLIALAGVVIILSAMLGQIRAAGSVTP